MTNLGWPVTQYIVEHHPTSLLLLCCVSFGFTFRPSGRIIQCGRRDFPPAPIPPALPAVSSMSSVPQSGPLSPHLHTEECNRIIETMYRCFDERSLVSRLFGSCDREFMAMKRCTRAERIARHTRHNAEAAVRQARSQAAVAQQMREKSLEEVLESLKSKRNRRDTPH